jgi:hypothetical protein
MKEKQVKDIRRLRKPHKLNEDKLKKYLKIKDNGK